MTEWLQGLIMYECIIEGTGKKGEEVGKKRGGITKPNKHASDSDYTIEGLAFLKSAQTNDEYMESLVVDFRNNIPTLLRKTCLGS